VAVFASSPALRAGLTALLSEDERLIVLTDDALAACESPDVILLESGASDLIGELIDDQWPRSALLFVGEPPEEALSAGDRVVGAVSVGIEGSRLSTAVQAMAAGLVVIDPELNASAQIRATPAMPPDQPDILTPRERQVLELVARGYPNKSIAYELGISEHTAKFHVGSLLTKLNAASRAEVVTNATRRRRDLALLETLGFRIRQVTETIASHAVTIAVLGLVVGIPLGVLVGRLAWSAVAHSVGIDPAADVPALLVLATVPAALFVVLVMSVYPARRVTRMRPAVALRSE